ncbi:hypothetical protein [Thalassospira profundimaris]|uniref:Uncharacterized protein n=1 Tax=Thalassospira profundimaris TaxID=502049 RepID=A0A367WPA0_9PROT|nr:hypothetical protein [Thalassospira profundimaris]RCK43237.1 hypothetical protein TH30_19670 [Thalassospira profundimaris]
MNEEARQAGIAILKDLALWNRSSVFLEAEMEKTAIAQCEEALIDWCVRHQWIKGGHASGDLEQNWFCPRAWLREKAHWYGYFYFCRKPGHSSNSYTLADLVGEGQTTFGFYFTPEYSVFGGATLWKSYIATYPEVLDQIARQGWHSLGEGEFFLGGDLTLEMLQKAWESGNWAYLTDPIIRKMDKLYQDSALFDELFAGGLENMK